MANSSPSDAPRKADRPMPQAPPPVAYRARWVLPVAGPPLRDAALTTAFGHITAVGPPPAGAEVVDLGSVILVPGLINAHTHLEFSALQRPLGRPGMSLPEWIRVVLAWRALRDAGADTHIPTRVDAIRRGLAECLAAGTTYVGEILAEPFDNSDVLSLYPESPLAGIVFFESIGLGETRRNDSEIRSYAQANSMIHFSTKVGKCKFPAWHGGVNPHAPYTAHPELVKGLCRISKVSGFSIAMHLAESREELELLIHQTGPFRELLEERGVWEPSAFRTGGRPLDSLEQLAQAERALVVHGNYLDEEEIAFIAARAERLSVVYCPRTHAYFGHEPHPLPKLLAAGANVCLGTDGRGSNPDLSLLAEMRFLAALPQAPPLATILELATYNAARALGCEHHRGSLTPGKRAEATAVAIPASAEGEPHELLLTGAAEVAGVILQGEWRAAEPQPPA